MEDQYLWEESFVQSVPLIKYAVLSGASKENIAKVVRTIEDPHNFECKNNDLPEIEPTVISRLPNIDRVDYKFPSAINDLVFIYGFKLLSVK